MKARPIAIFAAVYASLRSTTQRAGEWLHSASFIHERPVRHSTTNYYQNKHLPLAGRCWAGAGMVGGEALLGQSTPNGS